MPKKIENPFKFEIIQTEEDMHEDNFIEYCVEAGDIEIKKNDSELMKQVKYDCLCLKKMLLENNSKKEEKNITQYVMKLFDVLPEDIEIIDLSNNGKKIEKKN